MENQKISVFLVRPLSKVTQGLVDLLGNEPKCELIDSGFAADAMVQIQEKGHGIVLCYIKDQMGFSQVQILLNGIQDLISNNKVKLVIISKLQNPADLEILRNLGQKKIYDESVSIQKLKFEFDQILTSVFYKVYEHHANDKKNIEFEEPFPIQFDFWYFVQESLIYENNYWAFAMVGPDPIIGKWTEVKTKKWEWSFDSSLKGPPYDQINGKWTFYGEKPNFSGGFWVFCSQEPQFNLFLNEKDMGNKVSLNEEKNSLKVKPISHASRKIFDYFVGLLEKDKHITKDLVRKLWLGDFNDSIVEELKKKIQEDSPELAGKLSDIINSVHENKKKKINEIENLEAKKIHLNPLSVGFLMSEIMPRPGLSVKYLTDRFCSYVSSSLEDQTVEFWLQEKDSQWNCAGSNDGFPGRLHKLAELTEKKKPTDVVKMSHGEETVWVAPLYLKELGERLCGLLMVISEPGKQVSPVQIKSLIDFSTGILKTHFLKLANFQ